MKKTLVLPILMILLVPVILLTGSDFTLHVSAPLITEKEKNSIDASVTVTYSGITKKFLTESNVQLSDESFFISGEMPDYKINEKDFLYSGINIDLNSDNDFDDTYSLNKFKGVYYLDEHPLKEVISKYRFNRLTIYSYYKKNSKAAEENTVSPFIPFIVYKIDYSGKKISAGLGSAEHPLSFSSFQNPCVVIAAMRPVKEISEKAGFTFEGGKSNLTYSNEKIFDDYPDSWLAVIWTVIPLEINKTGKSDIICTIKNIKKPYALRAWACLSLETGTVLQTDPAVTIIR